MTNHTDAPSGQPYSPPPWDRLPPPSPAPGGDGDGGKSEAEPCGKISHSRAFWCMLPAQHLGMHRAGSVEWT